MNIQIKRINRKSMEAKVECIRCKINKGVIHCDQCMNGGIYCESCDQYLHSLPSKRNHNRYVSNPVPISNQNFNQEETFKPSRPVFDNNYYANSNKYSNTYNYEEPIQRNSPAQNYIDEIKRVYETERADLIKEIESLRKTLNDTRNQMGGRIDFLHSHLEEMNKAHELELNSANATHYNQLEEMINERDTRIKALVEALDTEKKNNQELLYKISEYENKMKENQIYFEKEMNDANARIEGTNREFMNSEDFYKKKIDEMNNLHEIEKKNIIASYETAIEKLNQGYTESKTRFSKYVQEREEYIKNVTKEYDNDKKELTDMYNGLKESNETIKRDLDELLNMNETLKKSLEQLNNEYDNYKKENKDTIKQNKKLQERVEELTNTINGLYKDKQKEEARYNRLTRGIIREKK